MKKDDNVYLEHIAEAVGKIDEYLNEMNFEEFSASTIVIDAVIRQFEIIGEAANNVSGEFKQKYPSLPWVEMIGMRNQLIHEYFGVDLKVIWRTYKEDLPELKKQLKRKFKYV